MAEEPVKIKMTLRAARPSIQGAAPPSPSAQAAIDAVEARWRTEDKKEKKERRKKGVVGCLSWLVILLAAAGAAWYFLGAKYLPAEYTFPQVWQKIQSWWAGTADPVDPVAQPAPDPADVATEKEREQIKAFSAQLKRICSVDVSKMREIAVLDEKGSWPVGQQMLKEIVSADSGYIKAKEKFAAMNEQNAKLNKRRGIDPNSSNGGFINQYSSADLVRQSDKVEKLEENCKNVRAKVAMRAISAVRVATKHWTGPESKKDAARFISDLTALNRRVNG